MRNDRTDAFDGEAVTKRMPRPWDFVCRNSQREVPSGSLGVGVGVGVWSVSSDCFSQPPSAVRKRRRPAKPECSGLSDEPRATSGGLRSAESRHDRLQTLLAQRGRRSAPRRLARPVAGGKRQRCVSKSCSARGGGAAHWPARNRSTAGEESLHCECGIAPQRVRGQSQRSRASDTTRAAHQPRSPSTQPTLPGHLQHLQRLLASLRLGGGLCPTAHESS